MTHWQRINWKKVYTGHCETLPEAFKQVLVKYEDPETDRIKTLIAYWSKDYFGEINFVVEIHPGLYTYAKERVLSWKIEG